jgi:hypothetical protein
MPDPFILLRRPTPPIRHPADVARLRAALEAAGYTASDEDIRWAWEQFSRAEWGEAWVTPKSKNDPPLVAILLEWLAPEKTNAPA